MKCAHDSVLVACLLLLAGCGVCGQVQQHRAAFEDRLAGSNEGHAAHLRLTIPEKEIRGWERRAVSALPPAFMSVPGLGDMGRHLSRLELIPRSVTLDSTEEQLRVAVDVDVKRGQEVLFGLEFNAKAPTHYDSARGRLSIDVEADLFESVKPRLQGDAIASFRRAMLRGVPQPIARLLPKKRLDRLAKKAVEHVLATAYETLRGRVLRRIGTLTSFALEFPRLPLAAIRLTTQRKQWIVDVQTTLSAPGLGPVTEDRGKRIRLDVSTFAMAQIGNWAMREGHIPSRYTPQGRASTQGAFTAGVAWTQADRPLKVHLWTAAPEQADVCVRVKAGGEARLAYANKKLAVHFTEGHLEEAVGPPLFESALDILGITDRVFDFTRVIAVDSKLKLGGAPVPLKVESAALTGNRISFELTRRGTKQR